MEGKIVRLMKEKNFGFIKSGDKDYFFHASTLKNTRFEFLNIGDEVEFEDVETDKGLRAEDVYVS